MNAKVKRNIGIVVNIVLWLFLIFAIVVTILTLVSTASKERDGIASLGGNAMVTVQSDSMSGTFEKGDMLNIRVKSAIKSADLQSLEIGDVISFYVDLDGNGTEEINTHRIFKIETDDTAVYRTKGDHNTSEDAYTVVWNKIVGVWESEELGIKGSKVNGFGYIINFLQSSVGFLCVIVIPMGVFFIYEIVHFVLVIAKLRQEKKAPATGLTEEEIKKKAIEEYIRQQEEEQNKANNSEENETK